MPDTTKIDLPLSYRQVLVRRASDWSCRKRREEKNFTVTVSITVDITLSSD
jgi:hypothetical protein